MSVRLCHYNARRMLDLPYCTALESTFTASARKKELHIS